MAKVLTEQLITEAQRRDLKEKLDDLIAQDSTPERLKADLRKLREELSSSDWGRLSGIMSLFWYKFDRVTDFLSDIKKGSEKANDFLKSIERNTGR